MRLLLVGLLAACGSSKEPPPPTPGGVKVPPHAYEVHTKDEAAGLRDSRTVITFCLPKDHQDELAQLPCVAAPTCTYRKLHTEITVTVEERERELFVTVVDAEYDNCLFEGCPKPSP